MGVEFTLCREATIFVSVAWDIGTTELIAAMERSFIIQGNSSTTSVMHQSSVRPWPNSPAGAALKPLSTTNPTIPIAS